MSCGSSVGLQLVIVVFPDHTRLLFVGSQMGTKCALLVADLFLFCYEWNFFCGSFMFLFCLVFAMFCARLFICALWSPAGKGLTSWLSFVVSNCEFVTFPLVSWVRCGT